jgi:hypothetical protein
MCSTRHLHSTAQHAALHWVPTTPSLHKEMYKRLLRCGTQNSAFSGTFDSSASNRAARLHNPHRVPIQLLKTHDSCCPYQSLLTQPLWLDPLDHPLSMLAPVRLPCRGDFDHMPFLLALSDHQPCCVTHSMIRHRRIHPRSNWVNNTSC